MILRFFHFDARASLHIIQVATREFAIISIAGDAKINITIRCGVRSFLLDQALDEFDD